MSIRKQLRWKRRSGKQNQALADYKKLGYKDTGLDWEGRMVLTKKCEGHHRDTAIIIDRDGTTRVRSVSIGDHPHTATIGLRR